MAGLAGTARAGSKTEDVLASCTGGSSITEAKCLMQTYRTGKHQVARSTRSTGPKNDALKIEGKWFHYHGPLQFEVPGLATFRLHGGASRVRNPSQW